MKLLRVIAIIMVALTAVVCASVAHAISTGSGWGFVPATIACAGMFCITSDRVLAVAERWIRSRELRDY